MAFTLANAGAFAMAGDGTHTGLLTLLNGGFIKFYGGTQAATPDTAPSGSPLASFQLANPAATVNSAGVMTFTPPANTAIANADTATTVTWFRITSAGGTNIGDGTVGLTGADVNFSTLNGGVSWITGGTCVLSSFVLTVTH